ncbi:MAG: fumarate hydratase C-terminal domain-containing protein [Candidatus Freyarchaeota archaeon]|nr:fumarate hydratase C-terminal domain-containing protein [Candidatus Jordarchaeia archaeon]
MSRVLKTPLVEEDVRSLHVGDVVFLSGVVVTARDAAHRRMIEHIQSGKPIPVNLRGGVIYHCGPIIRRLDDGRMEVISAGPTTSSRMDIFEPFIISRLGARMIIGKGGMGGSTIDAMKRYGAVYAAFPGGAGVLAASKIKRVVGVEWMELGMPEALWILEVESFGPLVIAIDSSGKSLYARGSR